MSTRARSTAVVRIDLHCHSLASTEADEALLLAIKCPESYSSPQEVYAQARERGMDFVTITDHDSIEGVLSLRAPGQADVLMGEELTCYFPEDGCKMHVLVWGITRENHEVLQSVAGDIYQVARYIAGHRIAHSVAHPLYRQNDLLERWHLERLVLLFKGFETLNGAHSMLHRESIEAFLSHLTAAETQRLSDRHELAPLWPEPHVKSWTGGSDDHGLLNIGRTWTEFAASAASTPQDVLECLRTGRCRPGGEAGSSLKLAHNFLSVGVKYHARQFVTPDTTPTHGAVLMQKLVGERPPYRRRHVIGMAVKNRLRAWGGALLRPFCRRRSGPEALPQSRGVALLGELFFAALSTRLGEHPDLTAAMAQGRAPLAEHESVFALLSSLTRDISRGIAAALGESLKRGELGSAFDVVPAVLAQQFIMLPYYFAMFHQNRERRLLSRITGHVPAITADNLRVAVFTDTLDDINGVSRHLRDMVRQAERHGRRLTVVTCSASAETAAASPLRRNFEPLVSGRLPGYPLLEMNLPPIVEILEWCDRQQFDAVHVTTPGPMGLCGLAAGAMLRVPAVGTYHTDFPAYVQSITGDHRLTQATATYMRWLYKRLDRVLSRTRKYETSLREMGVAAQRMSLAPPAVDTAVFSPARRDPNLWRTLGVRQTRQLLYVGRLSVEKNLPMLVEIFKRVRRIRQDTALVVAGDGPYLESMRRALDGLPAYLLGALGDEALAPLYASADLLVFPSRTDTMGQVVLEAQACGLPVLVSDEGGPQEVMAHDITGLVLPGADPSPWVSAIHSLLGDEPRRQRMAHSGPGRMARFSLEAAFTCFWNDHLEVVTATAVGDARDGAPSAPAKPAREAGDPRPAADESSTHEDGPATAATR